MRGIIVFFLYLMLVVVAVGTAAFGVMRYMTLTRGVEPNFAATEKVFGTNVALELYASDADLARAVAALKGAGLNSARQYFPWREIEPERGTFDWAKWDRVVNAARENGIELVAVLDTAPAWSQRAHEREMPNAPPEDFGEYARFAGEFARRYGDALRYYEIWDEPNVEPNWGKRNADPVEYAELLIPASEAIRANDPDAKILLAGLAMNLELHRPHPNYSEILFLRGLYEIGANKYWDIVAAKPYGMWTGPEDRTVNSGTLNFSRLILLRDEMRQYGDAGKPIWAVEMGWNALPANWTGGESPWGTDTEEKQADRLTRGLARAAEEWAWVTGVFPLYLQPKAAAEDPRWGFAMMTRELEPRAAYEALKASVQSAPRVPAGAGGTGAPALPVALLGGVALVAGWRAWHWLLVSGLDARWRTFKARVNALPELGQFLVILGTAAAFYFSPSVPLNFVLLALLVLWCALRLDFGITLAVFAIPFWNYPKGLFGGFELSPVEVLTWAATAGFLTDAVLSGGRSLRRAEGARGRGWFAGLTALDWAALAFLGLGMASTRWAGNFGVASREFRIVVLDPILLYGLIRWSGFPWRQTRWFVNALLASGAAVCAIGLYLYFTGDVILADGVARLTAVWGSPNNVGLYLGRLLPIALALGLTVRGGERDYARWVYAGLVVAFGVTILLTYSRGALFLGVPASAGFVLVVLYLRAHRLSRRARLAIGGGVILGLVALVPFLLSERFGSWFQAGTGTGFFRIAVWTSAAQMIRDHPWLGVGLDNFLYEYPKYILPEAWREPNLSHPHNFVLDFWVRLGIGGLLIFLWTVAAFFKRAWGTFTTTGDVYVRALMLGLMGSVVDMLAHGLIDAAFFVVDLAYMFLLTLALAQTRGERG